METFDYDEKLANEVWAIMEAAVQDTSGDHFFNFECDDGEESDGGKESDGASINVNAAKESGAKLKNIADSFDEDKRREVEYLATEISDYILLISRDISLNIQPELSFKDIVMKPLWGSFYGFFNTKVNTLFSQKSSTEVEKIPLITLIARLVTEKMNSSDSKKLAVALATGFILKHCGPSIAQFGGFVCKPLKDNFDVVNGY